MVKEPSWCGHQGDEGEKLYVVLCAFRSDKSHAVYYSIDSDVYKSKFLENWTLMGTIRKPIIAAVSGYAVRHSTPSLLWHVVETDVPFRP